MSDTDAAEPATPAAILVEEIAEAEASAEAATEEPVLSEKPKRPRRAAKPKKAVAETAEAVTVEDAVTVEPEQTEQSVTSLPEPGAEVEKPASRSRRKPGAPIASGEAIVAIVSTDAEETAKAAEDKPKKAGWWQRRSFF